MASQLGKRKRRTSIDSTNNNEITSLDHDQYQALFRQYFETAYEPLPETLIPAPERIDPKTEEQGPEWEGISDDDDGFRSEDTDTVEIIDHTTNVQAEDQDAMQARKSFMTSKLPSTDSSLRAVRNVKLTPSDKDPTSESALLANDLALQRLLRESHLLASADVHATDATFQLSGKGRHKALDSRLQALGAKKSILAPKNMPRAQRLGIVRKADERKLKKRREASEAGIVLEKEKKGPRTTERRARGVGAPAVGKFRGGTLVLSERDVREIQGPKQKAKRRKGRR